jgi:hypothetical protein
MDEVKIAARRAVASFRALSEADEEYGTDSPQSAEALARFQHDIHELFQWEAVDEAMRRLREELERDIPVGVDVDDDAVCYGCGVDFRDVSDLYAHLQERCLPDGYKDRLELWHTPLLTRYERARRIVFLRSRICNSPLLTRTYFAVEGPVYRVVWEVQHRYLMHTLKGIALEDYRVYVEDYEHWMSGSWESYLEERGYL